MTVGHRPTSSGQIIIQRFYQHAHIWPEHTLVLYVCGSRFPGVVNIDGKCCSVESGGKKNNCANSSVCSSAAIEC